MRKLVLIMLGMLFFSAQLLAQTRVLKGKVFDENGRAVPGASITVKGTKTGTVSNSNGEFTVNVPESAKTIIISGVGFTEQEVAIGTQTNFQINLKTDPRALDQVVVTGYTKEKRSQFVGAANVLGSKVVETVPVGAFDQALQGRAPGVLVNSGSGQPGSSANIVIRGITSLTGQVQPLYVIDGIPVSSSDFQTYNANDFESITVLKDASAAALYGARGSLGVIVITTKKGKQGTTNVQYRTQVGFTQAPNATNFNMMNTGEILSYEERSKISGTPGWNYSKLNPAYNVLVAPYTSLAQQQARYDYILDSFKKINTDIGDQFFRQGFSQQQEINVSGGTEKTRFYLSASYFDQKGTDIRSRLKRYSTRFNIDHTADKFYIQWNTTAGFSRTDLTEGEWYGNSTRNTFQMSWRAKPYENPYRADGTLIFGTSTGLLPKVIGNAIEGIQNSSLYDNQIKVTSGLTAGYKITRFLTIQNRLGIDMDNDVLQRWIRPDSYIGSLQTFNRGYITEASKNYAQLTNTASLVFSDRFAQKHEVEAGAYFETGRLFQRAIGYTAYYLDPRVPQTGQYAGTASGGYNPSGSSAKSGWGSRSYFATTRYTYDNKYTLSANLRRDGTSRILRETEKQITTYSFGAIWNAINENFMRSQHILTDMRVRGSYGSVPNIGSIPTTTYSTFGGLLSVTNYLGAQVPLFGSATYVASTIPGIVPTGPGNPDLVLEYVKQLNVGVDFAFWKNRARFSVDYYNKQTHDLFARQPLPGEAGFGVAYGLSINAGRLSNKGFEFIGSVDVVRTKSFELTVGANHSINKNKIEDLGLVDEYVSGTFLIRKGLPVGSHYTYHYLGADPATGRPTYETKDGGTTNNLAQAGQFAKFGSYVPVHQGGFNADVRFGNITVSAFFSYQFDCVRSNNIENWIMRGTSGYQSAVNGSRRLLTEQWYQPGNVVSMYYQNTNYDKDFTSADLQRANFMRFRNLNIAYQIPGINAGRTKLIKGARFYIQAQNLYIWSTWRGPDPEDNNNISLNEFPNPRMVVTGIDINL